MTDIETEEFYDEAGAAFPSVEDLAPTDPPFGDGRLVAIWALENGTGKGTNGPYGYTETVTLALDDGPDGTLITEMVGMAPYRVDMRHSTGWLHGKLKGRVEGKHPKTGVPLKYRPFIGRVNTVASTANKKVAAFGIAAPSDEDKATIEQHKSLIISINKEMEAKDKDAEDRAAFE